MLLAEHNFISVGLTVAGMVVPGAIFVFVQLAKLNTKLNNGLCKQMELMRQDLASMHKEHGKRIHDLEIADAKREGGASGIHS